MGIGGIRRYYYLQLSLITVTSIPLINSFSTVSLVPLRNFGVFIFLSNKSRILVFLIIFSRIYMGQWEQQTKVDVSGSSGPEITLDEARKA